MAARTPKEPPSKVIGAKAYVAISAVEGLKLDAARRRRIRRLLASDLSGEERRAEVLRAYRDAA